MLSHGAGPSEDPAGRTRDGFVEQTQQAVRPADIPGAHEIAAPTIGVASVRQPATRTSRTTLPCWRRSSQSVAPVQNVSREPVRLVGPIFADQAFARIKPAARCHGDFAVAKTAR